MEDTAAPSHRRDGRRAAALAVVAVTLIASLAVTWAASVGPGTVVDGEGFGSLGSATPTPTSATPSPTATTTAGEGQPQSGEMPLVLQVLAVGMAVALTLVLLALVALAAWQVWRLRPARRVRRVDVDFAVLEADDATGAVSAAITDDAAAQLAALREGTPRNGIVACWARFERQAAAAGVRPEPWETSSEFALRILDMVQADTSAVAALAELFREARFSEHEVTEADRAAAVRLLGDIHASLGRRQVGAGP